MDTDAAKDLVQLLLDEGGMNPQEISEALESRVSPRTIYRWAKGESVPGNSSDLEALQQLVQSRVRKESA
jgi:hypothetical protein